MVIFALAAGCTSKDKGADTSAAPDFTLQDLSGRSVKLSAQKGKVVLIEFWATWCPPCRESIPWLNTLQKRYADKGLVILAVSVDEGGWDDVQKFAVDHQISYPVLQGTDEVAQKYQVRLIPSLYLVDKLGMIKKQHMGGGNEEELEQEIKALL
jgi:thiol-disulfide isomerase/thioredoxin